MTIKEFTTQREIPSGEIAQQEEQSLAYLNYFSRPRLTNAIEAISKGTITFKDGNIICLPQDRDLKELGERIVITPEHQYNLVEATLFGLNDVLVRAEQGSSVRERFDEEFNQFNQSPDKYSKYGVYVFYPGTGDLIHCASEYLHRLALVTSNSSLYLDPERKMTWEDVRNVFDNLVVSVAGASVGNNIAHSITMDIRPKMLKTADPRFVKLTNANRVKLSYRDIVWSNAMRETQFTSWGLKNKAVITAEQIHSIDPFMQIWAYFDGVNKDNIKSFVSGNRFEPESDFIVEETDDPEIKMLIREEARKARKRVVMATDMGSAVQIDIRNFDTNPKSSLALNISDEELYERQNQANKRLGDRIAFMKFVDGLIGEDYRTCEEFGEIMEGKLEKLFASIPQAGSTAATAGGIVAEVIARSALGYKFPERFIINKSTRKVKEFGELV